jgi:hypothetical protein
MNSVVTERRDETTENGEGEYNLPPSNAMQHRVCLDRGFCLQSVQIKLDTTSEPVLVEALGFSMH